MHKLHALLRLSITSVKRPRLKGSTSLSIQEKGRQICVNRNYPKYNITEQVSGTPNNRLSSKYIYAFPKVLDHIPPLNDLRFHKVKEDADRLTEDEHAKVKSWFDCYTKERDKIMAMAMLGDQREYLPPPSDKVLINPSELDLCPLANLLHFIVDTLDVAELQCERQLTIVEIEQLIQAMARFKRRIQMTGVLEKNVHYKLFKEYDDQILLSQEAVPERSLRRGDSLYRKRTPEQIKTGRMIAPPTGDKT